jgi:predicted ATP-grasp superfamily ATP-dependent carboligase/protein-tyrosine-phosphatase
MRRRSRTGRKALVLGHDTRAFLSVIRSLGRAGIEVHVAWFEEGAPALRSRYVATNHRIPGYGPGGAEWKDALKVLMRRERFDLVLPCDDQCGLPLAAHRAELERWGRICLPDAEALEVLGDKLKTTDLARSLGLPVPREAIVSNRRQMTSVRERFAPPLILKPPTSYTLADVEAKRMVRRADSWEEVDVLLSEMTAKGPVAVQELCRGVGIGVELLLSEGVPLLAFQHVRLHEPLHGGGSSYRRGVPVSNELLDASLTLLGTLRYTGVAMVEFKREPETGRWVLLEINPRFWGSLPLALASGADFPLALFQLLVEGRTEVADGYRAGLCARNLRADARWHLTNLRADRSDPTLNTRPWPGVVWETCSSLLMARERSDTFTLDDPAPGFAEASQITRDIARHGRLLAACAYARLSRRRRRRLRVAARTELRRAARVLFVCKGNVCRSPFAAAITTRLLQDGQDVSSAGFLEAGRCSPADAVAAADGWQVDLSAHRSSFVSRELVQQSDAIFVFDDRNYSRMVARFPEARDRLHLFGALDRHGPLSVPDPWGRGPDACAAVYRRIALTLADAITR